MSEKKREISEAVGAKIRQLRKAKAMSQEELALKSDLSPAYYGLVERGVKCPSIETIWKIAAGLDVPPSELLRTEAIEDDLKEYTRRLEDFLVRIPADRREKALRILEEISGLF